jgi:hypothetical protein
MLRSQEYPTGQSRVKVLKESHISADRTVVREVAGVQELQNEKIGSARAP